VVTQSPHKERADGPLRLARRIDYHASASPSFSAHPAQPAHGLTNRPTDHLVVEALEEAIQHREIGHAGKPQNLTQFAMFPQTDLGLAKGPILLAHQTENRQQLRLRELVFAETGSVTRKHRPRDFEGDSGKGQESDFGRRTSCLRSKQRFPGTCGCEFSRL
jgi:hypothetical protein